MDGGLAGIKVVCGGLPDHHDDKAEAEAEEADGGGGEITRVTPQQKTAIWWHDTRGCGVTNRQDGMSCRREVDAKCLKGCVYIRSEQ